MNPTPVAHTIEQASRLSGIGRTKLYQAIKNGQLAARKFGKRTIIPADALREFVASLPLLICK